MKCPKCGKNVTGNFCSSCGSQLAPTSTTSKSSVSPAKHNEWYQNCPACASGPLKKTVTSGFLGLSVKDAYTCPKCGATFVPGGYRIQLTSISDPNNPVWKKHARHELTADEWKAVTQTEGTLVQQRERDTKKYLDRLQQGNVPIQFVDASQVPIMLKSGEELIMSVPMVSFHEPKSVSTTIGGHAGPSYRIGKGVSFRTGIFVAESQSREEVKFIDQGSLVLTSKRLVFMGQKRTNAFDLTKIISVEPYATGLALRRDGKQKTEYYYGLDHVSATINMDNRQYDVTLDGPMFLCMIQGLLNRS